MTKFSQCTNLGRAKVSLTARLSGGTEPWFQPDQILHNLLTRKRDTHMDCIPSVPAAFPARKLRVRLVVLSILTQPNQPIALATRLQ